MAVDLTEPDQTLAQLDSVGQKATGLIADVSDPEQTRAVGEEVRQRHGRCDILVNNAGIYPFFDIDDLD